jgi:hypothetical protein
MAVRVRAVGRYAWQYRHLQNVSGTETLGTLEAVKI